MAYVPPSTETDTATVKSDLIRWRAHSGRSSVCPPSMSVELKTKVGMIGVNLCGTAKLSADRPLAPTVPKATDSVVGVVACETLRSGAGKQPAYLLPTGLIGDVAAPDAPAGCQTFGSGAALPSLLLQVPSGQ